METKTSIKELEESFSDGTTQMSLAEESCLAKPFQELELSE